MKKLICKRCGHDWTSTKRYSRRCPKCKSLHWRTPKGPITQERVKELFDYDFLTGDLVWRESFHPLAIKGGRAGSVKTNGSGYYRIGVDGKNYRLHSIIYLWHYGVIPELIDHIDQDTTNCKIDNLRPADRYINSVNSKVRSDNTSGYRGVGLYRGKWVAYISSGGTRKHLGCFYTKEEAVCARLKAELRLSWDKINIINSTLQTAENDHPQN